MLEKVQSRLDRNPDAIRVRRSTLEHPFDVLAYNMKRVIAIMGVGALLEVMAG